jgi:hypothetical protein
MKNAPHPCGAEENSCKKIIQSAFGAIDIKAKRKYTKIIGG